MTIEQAVILMILGNPSLIEEMDMTADDFFELSWLFREIVDGREKGSATQTFLSWLWKELKVEADSEGVRSAIINRLRTHTEFQHERKRVDKYRWELKVFKESALSKRDERIAELERRVEELTNDGNGTGKAGEGDA